MSERGRDGWKRGREDGRESERNVCALNENDKKVLP